MRSSKIKTRPKGRLNRRQTTWLDKKCGEYIRWSIYVGASYSDVELSIHNGCKTLDLCLPIDTFEANEKSFRALSTLIDQLENLRIAINKVKYQPIPKGKGVEE